MSAAAKISSAWKGFRALPQWQQVLIAILILLAIYVTIRKIGMVIKKGKIYRDIINRATDKIEVYHEGNTWLGLPPYTEYVSLTEVANNIYEAFYNNDWFGLTEDETEAANQLRRVPKEYITELSQTYARDHAQNLYEDFRRFLSADYYNETVAYLLS